MKKHRVVIAGAGFGGVRAAQQLAKSKKCQITVISDRDTFRYYPALYATATGHSHDESIIPLGEMLGGYDNITIQQDTVEELDKSKKRIRGASGEWYKYDSLILALGMVTNYFGIDGLEEFSFGIKSKEEVDSLRDHLHGTLTDDNELDPNYVVVGAGATGVELAASLRAYMRDISYCHGASSHDANVDLIEAAGRVLPRMSNRTSKLVEKRLRKLGINVMLDSKVKGATAKNLAVGDEQISTQTVVWTSGVSNNPFFAANAAPFKLAKNGKVETDEFLQGAPSIYVIGDNAFTPYSGLAQTALHDADTVAKNIKRQTRHQRPKRYKPRVPPMVVPAGKQWAVFEWGPVVFGGRLGHWLRRAADFVAYNDLLPPTKAWKLWRSASRLEESCPVCRDHLITDAKKATNTEV